MYFSVLLYNVFFYSLQYDLLLKKQFVQPGITKTTFKHPTHQTYNHEVKTQVKLFVSAHLHVLLGWHMKSEAFVYWGKTLTRKL